MEASEKKLHHKTPKQINWYWTNFTQL